MEIQSRFSYDKVNRPYAGICCESCWTAKKEKCVCHCGGVYHGLGRGKPIAICFHVTPDIADQIRKKLSVHRCQYCGADLMKRPISAYPHSGGWKVSGYTELLWLFIHCLSCHYDWAIWKLGVSREEEFS